MTDDRLDDAESIFQIAADMPPAERDSFLSARCGGDAPLRALVDRLLHHHDGGMPQFLEPPANLVANSGPGSAELPLTIGPYEILRKIGEGGMATVYEARQSNPRRVVALKVIRGSSLDRELIRRFHFETMILAQLGHPGVARVYEAGETAEGIPYFAMELVHGLPLTDYAQQNGLEVAARLELMGRVCDAIQHAHDAGVLHRDLKPANILVTDDEGSLAQPKVLDFGVARRLRADLQTDSPRTITGQMVGTLAYMSPEQIAGKSDELDVRSDVYQLGVILYELLAGRRPFAVTNLPLPQAGRVILEEEPPPLRSIDTRFRGDVEAIVGKAMSKEKERRYASAAALGDDIRRYLKHEQITARPTSGIYRLRKFARRRREVVTGLAVGLVATILAVIAFVIRPGGSWNPGPPPPRATQLTSLPRGNSIHEAAISPDGTKLAFQDSRGIFLQDIASKEIKPLPLVAGAIAGGTIRWHPTEGTLLLPLRVGGHWAWHRVFEDGTTEPVLAAAAESAIGQTPSDLRASPAGRRYLCLAKGARELWVVDDDDQRATRLLEVAEGSTIYSPVWSPTGETIAYLASEDRSSPFALWSVDLAGKTALLGEPDGRWFQEYAVSSAANLLWWLPDGRLVCTRAMARPNSTSSEIWALPVDPRRGIPNGEPRVLAGWVGSGIGTLSGSVAGDRLAFLKREQQDDIFSVALDAEGRFAGEPNNLTVDRGLDRPGMWSRDGEQFYFESDRFGNADVLVQRPGEMTPAKFLVGQERYRPLCLAPGGDHLLVSRQEVESSAHVGTLAVLRVPESGGDPEFVTRLGKGEWLECGVHADAPCVLARMTDSVVTFYFLDENWLPGRELGSVDVGDQRYHWALEPTGRELALVTSDGTVRLLDLASGKWHMLRPEPRAGLQAVTYSSDGKSLYVSQMFPYAIARITRDGRSEVLWSSKRTWVWMPRVSPDGKRLAFCTREHYEDVWMLEGF